MPKIAGDVVFPQAPSDKITVTAPHGMKDVYKREAKKRGISVNQLFLRAVSEYIKSDFEKSDFHKGLNEEFLKAIQK